MPALLVVVADNQRPVADCCVAAGCAATLDARPDAASDVAADAVAFVRKLFADEPRRAVMALAGRVLVDGRGAERVVDAMLPVLDAMLPVLDAMSPVSDASSRPQEQA